MCKNYLREWRWCIRCHEPLWPCQTRESSGTGNQSQVYVETRRRLSKCYLARSSPAHRFRPELSRDIDHARGGPSNSIWQWTTVRPKPCSRCPSPIILSRLLGLIGWVRFSPTGLDGGLDWRLDLWSTSGRTRPLGHRLLTGPRMQLMKPLRAMEHIRGTILSWCVGGCRALLSFSSYRDDDRYCWGAGNGARSFRSSINKQQNRTTWQVNGGLVAHMPTRPVQVLL